MLDSPILLHAERADDAAAIEQIHDRVFGPGRYVRTASRLRETARVDRDLCFVAKVGSKLVGSSQLTPLTIGGARGVLLGPLTVDPAFRCRGIGMALLKTSLTAALEKGYELVILIGDEPYYARAGFARVPPGRLALPGPFDPNRLLYKELVRGAFDAAQGFVKALQTGLER